MTLLRYYCTVATCVPSNNVRSAKVVIRLLFCLLLKSRAPHLLSFHFVWTSLLLLLSFHVYQPFNCIPSLLVLSRGFTFRPIIDFFTSQLCFSGLNPPESLVSFAARKIVSIICQPSTQHLPLYRKTSLATGSGPSLPFRIPACDLAQFLLVLGPIDSFVFLLFDSLSSDSDQEISSGPTSSWKI